MITTDIAPFAGTVGGGFFIGFIAGFAIKKVIRLAALAYLEYQRNINVDWDGIQTWSQTGITWVTDAITHTSIPIRYHISVFL